MQRFRTLSIATRCSLNSLCSLSQLKNFSAQPDYAPAINDLQSQVLVDGKAISRTAILNRPSNLNAFNTSMVARLKKLYESWEENNDIGFVMMKGSGRAFSAGGDVATIHQLMNEGEYLALTGEKLNGVEMIACGLATHYFLNARLALIGDRLGKLITDDPSIIESSLEQYGDLVFSEKRSSLHRIETIDKCFGRDTVEEIVDALEDEATNSYDDWGASALKKLKEASPLSLKLSLRSIREGRFQSLDQCLAHEYRMTVRGISKHVSHDFCEGVRARLVDKDHSKATF